MDSDLFLNFDRINRIEKIFLKLISKIFRRQADSGFAVSSGNRKHNPVDPVRE